MGAFLAEGWARVFFLPLRETEHGWPPGTVRVTPATLAGTSLTDGSNAPSPGSVGFLS